VRIRKFVVLLALCAVSLTSVVGLVFAGTATSASVWTTDSAATPKNQFFFGERVYIYWDPTPVGSSVDIVVVNSANTVVAGPWTEKVTPADAPLSFVPPLPGKYEVRVNGQPAATFKVAALFLSLNLFAVPESVLGTIAALGAGFAAFAFMKVKKGRQGK
jgi:hypothetical protein